MPDDGFLICSVCAGPIDEGRRKCPYCGADAADARPPEPEEPADSAYDSGWLEPAPRDVPITLAIAALFGGVTSVLGWIFVAFGSIFVGAFVLQADLGPLTSWMYSERTPGVVTACDSTSWSVGGSDNSPGTPVYVISYEFMGGGETLQGRSFSVGKTMAAGSRVEVLQMPGRPEHSRIEGLMTGPAPCWTLFVLIFPGVGLGLAVGGLRSGLRSIRLLRKGTLTRGTLIRKEPTNTRINQRMVYKLTFSFTDEPGVEHEMSTRTHRPEKLEDEGTEQLIYDPNSPSTAVTLDDLPGGVKVDDNGRLASVSPRKALMLLILPGLAGIAFVVLALIAIS